MTKYYKLQIIIVTSLAVLFFIGIIFTIKANSSESPITFTDNNVEQNRIFKKFVYVTGEVKNPGVYEIKEGMIIQDAIDLAGGLTENTDNNYLTNEINLAERLKDEQKIFIKSKLEQVEGANTEKNISGLVNINNASLAELDSLPGIGPSTAQKIIDARPFSSIEELLDVSGIGDSKFNDVKNFITVN